MIRAALSILLLIGSPCALAQGRTLQHDPFARPQFGFLPKAKPATAPGVRRVVTMDPKLKLHGVLMAGPDSIANVDGVIVRIGESIHGYRLVAVQDRAAVFEKDSATFTLALPGPKK